MSDPDISMLKNKARDYFQNKEPTICEFGIVVNANFYYYGSIDTKGYFVINDRGELPFRDESILAFKKYLQAEVILEENSDYFQKCSARSLTIFDQLSLHLNKFAEKYTNKYKEIEQYTLSLINMLQAIYSGQNRLKECCGRIEEIKQKTQLDFWIEEKDVDILVELNNEINFILYTQIGAINDTLDSIKDFLAFIKENLNLQQKFSINTIALNFLLKQITSKKLIQQNREQLKTFEISRNGKHIRYEKGDLGLEQLTKNLNEKFEVAFNNDYIELLLN